MRCFAIFLLLLIAINLACAQTITCGNKAIGQIFPVNDINYTKVNKTMLEKYAKDNDTIALERSCTSGVTDMRMLFSALSSRINKLPHTYRDFNPDISSWDTSNVINMFDMFNNVSSFNQDLSYWDTSEVINMVAMFSGATSFNQDLSTWNTSKVTNMRAMFSGATSFNQDLSTWDTSKVTDMTAMFSGATSFNQDLSNWNTSKVTDMSGMFSGGIPPFFSYTTSFNQDLSNWNVYNVQNFDGMFYHATSFNQSLTNWCVNGSITSISNFSDFSPIDSIPEFQPLWNGAGCDYKCYNGGIRNLNDEIAYSCVCSYPYTGTYCNETSPTPVPNPTTNTFTWWMILSISVGGALLLSGVVFTARKLVTSRENKENNNPFVVS